MATTPSKVVMQVRGYGEPGSPLLIDMSEYNNGTNSVGTGTIVSSNYSISGVNYMYFDGAGYAYKNYAKNNFDFGLNDFCIDCFLVQTIVNSGTRTVLSCKNTSNNTQLELQLSGNRPQLYLVTADGTTTTMVDSSVLGMLTPLTPSSVALGVSARALATSIDGNFVYSALGTYQVSSTNGTLSKISNTGPGSNAYNVFTSRNGLFLYDCDQSFIEISAINTDGTLIYLNRTYFSGTFIYGAVKSIDDSYLFLTSDNSVGTYVQNLNGSVTRIAQSTSIGDIGRVAAVSPDGKYVYAATATEIYSFLINTNGSLTLVSSLAVGANSLAVLNSSFLYAAIGSSVFTIATNAGVMSQVTYIYIGDSAQRIVISPDGKNIYASNGFGGIIECNINALTGFLSIIATAPTAGLSYTAIAPSGKYLYANDYAAQVLRQYSRGQPQEIPYSTPTYLKAYRKDGIFALQVGSGSAYTQTITFSIDLDDTARIYVGASPTGTNKFTGYMSEVRVTNGISRSAEPVPTTSFPIDWTVGTTLNITGNAASAAPGSVTTQTIPAQVANWTLVNTAQSNAWQKIVN